MAQLKYPTEQPQRKLHAPRYATIKQSPQPEQIYPRSLRKELGRPQTSFRGAQEERMEASAQIQAFYNFRTSERSSRTLRFVIPPYFLPISHFTAGTSNESPALSRAASKADLTKESQPFATLPVEPSSSKQRKPQSSRGKSTEKRPELTSGDPGFVLDTDLTHMEGILAGHKDQPKRSKRHGSSSTAGNSSASSVKNTTSSGSSSKAQRNQSRSGANQPPMTLPTPAFLTGQFDLEPLPRSKRPRAQKSAYTTSPRTAEPPQLAPSLSMSPPSPVKGNTGKGSNERGDSKFPANSKWRINPPPSDYDIPKRLGGKRSGPPSPRQPDHVQLGGIKTSTSQTQTPPTVGTDKNVSPSGWQAPESWGIVQESANHNEDYESESSEENEGDGYYDDNDIHQRRASNYFDFNPKEDNWNGAFGEAATWGSPAFQRTSADQNSGVRPIKLKPLEHNDPSGTDVNEYVDESRKNSDTGHYSTRSRQESNASGGQIQHLTAEQGEPSEMGEDIRKASLRRVSSAKRQGSPGMQRPSTAGSASQQGSRGTSGNVSVDVHINPILLTLNSTASAFTNLMVHISPSQVV